MPWLLYWLPWFILFWILGATRIMLVRGQNKPDWWRFAILPSAFYLGTLLYGSLLRLDRVWIMQLLFLLAAAVIYYYYRYTYFYLFRPVKYRVASIENLSLYANFFSFFFTVAGLYGIQSSLNAPLWQFILFLSLFTVAVLYQLLWANKLSVQESIVFLLVDVLVIIELAWSLAFWPVNYHIAGLTLAIIYYCLSNLTRLHLLHELDKNKIKTYLIYSAGILALLWLTAQWV
jgi:hypothetical protein